MADALAIHSLTRPDELERARAIFATALLHMVFPDGDVTDLYEPGRTLGAVEAGEMVATATALSSWMVVPGGARLPHAAVTCVGVLGTHRRRGILTAVMRRQLADIAARGEVVASLRASEGGIYERFGYGVATRRGHFELDRDHARFRMTAPAGSRVRLVDYAGGETLRREVCAQMDWVGAIGRSEVWWTSHRRFEAADSGPRYLAVAEAIDGRVRGYASYGPPGAGGWAANPDLRVEVKDLVALDAPAAVGLLRFLAGLDLTRTVSLRAAPDTPLGGLFTDPRALQRKDDYDETWLRLIDVEGALAARTYRPAEPVVVAVSDPILEVNSASYLIAPSGAERVVGATRSPDVSLDVSALAAAYLGGTRWAELALAGRVVEHREGAIDALEELFRTERAPYAGTNF